MADEKTALYVLPEFTTPVGLGYQFLLTGDIMFTLNPPPSSGTGLSFAWSLPTTRGIAGDTLHSDGAGLTYWAAGGGGGSEFLTTEFVLSDALTPTKQIKFDAGFVPADTFVLCYATSHNSLFAGSFNDNLWLGELALPSPDGSQNTFLGLRSGIQAIDATNNTAVGYGSMQWVLTGLENTACGSLAMVDLDAGGNNSAFGRRALASVNNGSDNAAFGREALVDYVGSRTVAIGKNAGDRMVTGNDNVIIGTAAGGALETGASNIIIGSECEADAAARTNVIVIGTGSTSKAFDNSITLGYGTADSTRCFIQGIRGITTGAADGIAVLVDSNGQLGTVSSSARFKENIRDMDETTNNLYNLRPVVFNYISDASHTDAYGLIAEEVEEVMPELVVRDNKGQIETVQYLSLIPMILNELQKLKRQVDARE